MSSIQPNETRPARPRSLVRRLWREASRPFQQRTWQKWRRSLLPQRTEFLSQAGSVEQVGLDFLARLVGESQRHPGPIVEIGTLFGRTTTHLALCKARHQKIVTVDVYRWNPLGLTPESHFQLTSQVLHYLV